MLAVARQNQRIARRFPSPAQRKRTGYTPGRKRESRQERKDAGAAITPDGSGIAAVDPTE